MIIFSLVKTLHSTIRWIHITKRFRTRLGSYQGWKWRKKMTPVTMTVVLTV